MSASSCKLSYHESRLRVLLNRSLWLALCGALSLLAPHFLQASGLQPKLEVRLRTHLTSYASKPGTPFECVVLRSFVSDGLSIPQGSIVRGEVRKAQSVGLGFRHERAALELSFKSFETPAGRTFPLEAKLFSIDNAREEITERGGVKGVLAANNPGNLLNGFWARPSSNLAFRSLIGLTGAANQVWAKYSMGPIGAAGLFVVRCVLVKFPEPEIHLPPGTDMKLSVRLEAGDEVTAGEPAPRVEAGDSEFAQSLSEWLDARLSSIHYANGHTAPDRLNVVLLGSREQVIDAFRGAGWSIADPRGWGSSSRVYMAFSAMRGYHSAPVSPLLYRDVLPTLVFEKSFDTVTQRHHVRFWKAGKFRGEEVWLGAATHDSGVKFKLASMAFSHKIDSDIDVERAKILTDLNFAGCSEDALLIESPSPAADSSRVITDGRILVLAARSCSLTNDVGPAPPLPGNRFTRLTRRVVLETRNYLLRDNAYYWGYRMIRGSHNHVNPLLH